jgi:glycosyltransferase involved in cell wall biosynthesis
MSVSVIIPAYNEEMYLGGVLEALQSVRTVSQVVVVSDGSTDATVDIARQWRAQVIALPQNVGKGGAMAVGLQAACEEIVLFLDADLIGLTNLHVEDLLEPVLTGQYDMTIGIFEGGRLATDVAQVIAPFLSGQRCLRKSWLTQFKDLDKTGFGVEVALTKFAYEHDLRILKVNLSNITHVMKEEKLGIMRGFAYRLKMYWEIAKYARTGG